MLLQESVAHYKAGLLVVLDEQRSRRGGGGRRMKKSDLEKEEDEARALLFLAAEHVLGSARRNGEEVLGVQRGMARVSHELHPNR
jgi:hypothetical protein